jgi:hypothetical protein
VALDRRFWAALNFTVMRHEALRLFSVVLLLGVLGVAHVQAQAPADEVPKLNLPAWTWILSPSPIWPPWWWVRFCFFGAALCLMLWRYPDLKMFTLFWVVVAVVWLALLWAVPELIR